MRIEGNSEFDIAMQLIDQTRYAEAITMLDHQLQEARGIDRGIILYWEARCFTSMRRWQDARRRANEALAFTDGEMQLKIPLLVLSAFLVHPEESPLAAVVQLKAVLSRYESEMKGAALFDTYIGCKEALGKCLVLAGEYLEASKELEEVLGLQEKALSRYYTHFWLGLASEHLNAWDKARIHFEAALTEVPSGDYLARLRYELAMIAYNQHRLDDAKSS